MQIVNTLENLVVCFIFKFPHGILYISEASGISHRCCLYIRIYSILIKPNASVRLCVCERERSLGQTYLLMHLEQCWYQWAMLDSKVVPFKQGDYVLLIIVMFRDTLGIGHFCSSCVIHAPTPPNNESVEENHAVHEQGHYSSRQ